MARRSPVDFKSLKARLSCGGHHGFQYGELQGVSDGCAALPRRYGNHWDWPQVLHMIRGVQHVSSTFFLEWNIGWSGGHSESQHVFGFLEQMPLQKVEQLMDWKPLVSDSLLVKSDRLLIFWPDFWLGQSLEVQRDHRLVMFGYGYGYTVNQITLKWT